MRKLPKRLIGNKVIKELPLYETLLKNKNHRRLKVFFHKGLKCAYCSRTAARAVLTKASNGGIHLDLYTEDLMLMNIDHKIPKSKGGKNTLDNLDPSCCKCNTEKADKLL